jgi:transposase
MPPVQSVQSCNPWHPVAIHAIVQSMAIHAINGNPCNQWQSMQSVAPGNQCVPRSLRGGVPPPPPPPPRPAPFLPWDARAARALAIITSVVVLRRGSGNNSARALRTRPRSASCGAVSRMFFHLRYTGCHLFWDTCVSWVIMHSLSTRMKAILHYENVLKSIRRVACIYGVSKSTVARWVQDGLSNLEVVKHQRLSKPRKLKVPELQAKLAIALEGNPFMAEAPWHHTYERKLDRKYPSPQHHEHERQRVFAKKLRGVPNNINP